MVTLVMLLEWMGIDSRAQNLAESPEENRQTKISTNQSTIP